MSVVDLMKVVRLNMEHLYHVINKVVYVGMLCLAFYLIHMGQVMERFWLKRSDFTEHKEAVTELPTVLAYVLSPGSLIGNSPTTDSSDPRNIGYGEKFNISYGARNSWGVNLTLGRNEVGGGLVVLFEQIYGANFFKITPENFEKNMSLNYHLTYLFEPAIASKITSVGISLRPENSSAHVNNRQNKDGNERNFQIKVGERGQYVFKPESTVHLKSKETCRDRPYNELILNDLAKVVRECSEPCKNGQKWGDMYSEKLDKILEHLPFCNTSSQINCYWEKLGDVEKKVVTKPCTILEYNGELDVYQTSKNNSAWFEMQFLNPAKVTVKEEYLIYDAVSMISAIGGTMGLCVGFSFTAFVSCLLSFLELAIRKIKDHSEPKTCVSVKPRISDNLLEEKFNRMEERVLRLEQFKNKFSNL